MCVCVCVGGVGVVAGSFTNFTVVHINTSVVNTFIYITPSDLYYIFIHF